MGKLRLKRILQAIIIGGFAVFTFGFNHLAPGQSSMANMGGMSEHNNTSVQCQILCTTAIKPGDESQLVNPEGEDEGTEPYFVDFAIISLGFLGIIFVVKKLHLLSSWRPPDRTLLFGHFSDGL